MKLSLIYILSVSLLLSGCASVSLFGLGLTGVSFITTGKSVSDHVISAVVDQDCALHRVVFGQEFCSVYLAEDTLLATSTLDTVTESSEAQRSLFADNEIVESKSQSLLVRNHSGEKNTRVAEYNANNKRVHSQAIESNLVHYQVVGSFSELEYAQTRVNLYRHVKAHIIKNEQERAVKYRVVIGPFEHEANMPKVTLVKSTEQAPTWVLSVCKETYQPPPCTLTYNGQLIAKG